jgi:hypothetical protein
MEITKKKHLLEAQNSVYHSVVLESLKLKNNNFYAHVDINYL